jgi:hypothetical protein
MNQIISQMSIINRMKSQLIIIFSLINKYLVKVTLSPLSRRLSSELKTI